MQLPINPTDNDRLKTTKVTRMLDELDVLPAAPSQRPNFLRSRRTAAVLIDRALGNLAPDPSARKHCCNNAGDFAAILNDKFATALGTVHGGGSGDSNPPVSPLIESNFRDGVYKINGSAVTLADVWVEDLVNWGPAGDFTITPGLGYVKQDGGGPDYASNDGTGPVLAPGLLGGTISLAAGFTMLLEASVVYIDHDSHASVEVDLGLEMGDNPDWTTDWRMVAGPTITLGSGGVSKHQAQFITQGNYEVDDIEEPAPNSPMIIRLAASFTDTSVVFSLNGRPLQAGTPAVVGEPNFMAMSYFLTTSLMETICALEYVAFYPKFANSADLMTLTAP